MIEKCLEYTKQEDESKKLAWFNINNLPENMTEHTKNYINKFGNILEDALKEFKN